MEVLRFNCGLTGFRYQAGALPLAESPATAGGGMTRAGVGGRAHDEH
jgi:hypothetical protein